mmetsp:Transcript_4775/g.10523  ORF Transcript_4775/g.10523 Transcript_4775/m.10523 type:complete len:83 (-) Transcript_4775:48-296(-)
MSPAVKHWSRYVTFSFLKYKKFQCSLNTKLNFLLKPRFSASRCNPVSRWIRLSFSNGNFMVLVMKYCVHDKHHLIGLAKDVV